MNGQLFDERLAGCTDGRPRMLRHGRSGRGGGRRGGGGLLLLEQAKLLLELGHLQRARRERECRLRGWMCRLRRWWCAAAAITEGGIYRREVEAPAAKSALKA